MKEVRVVPKMAGRSLCLDITTIKEGSSDPPDKVPVLKAVDVSDFCSPMFVTGGGIAIVEYGRLSDGNDVLHFKTMFRGCGADAFMVSFPYRYIKMGRDKFGELLRSSPDRMLHNWGVDLLALVEAVFKHSPVPPPAIIPASSQA